MAKKFIRGKLEVEFIIFALRIINIHSYSSTQKTRSFSSFAITAKGKRSGGNVPNKLPNVCGSLSEFSSPLRATRHKN